MSILPKFFSILVIAGPLLHANELRVLDRYTTLRTIAGTGNLEDGNFWQPAFEGSETLQSGFLRFTAPQLAGGE